MSDKWNDIMSDPDTRINEKLLMDYLEGRLSAEEQHTVERMMAEAGFVDDAMEGLAQMKDKQRIATILHELNRSLQTRTRQQKRKYNQLIPDQQTLTIVSIISILLLVVMGFVIYKMMQS